jgi:hypothetical protein
MPASAAQRCRLVLHSIKLRDSRDLSTHERRCCSAVFNFILVKKIDEKKRFLTGEKIKVER